jgi:ubiquinone/menaquinone biosynthesis C-methylase UbiE
MSGIGLAARLYDPLLGPLVAGFRRAGLELAPSGEGRRVLDVGCGTGAHLALYEDGGAMVAGVDHSEGMLARARRRLGRGATLFPADAAALPFADASFDLVIAMTLLHELDSQSRSAVLAEMRRVAARDGRLLVIDHHPGRPIGLRGWLIRRFAAAIEWVAGSDHHCSFREFLRSGGLPALAGRHGMTVERWSLEASGTMGVYLLSRG